MPNIILKNGPESGTSIPLGKGSTSIGRAPESSIRIEEEKAASHHAEILTANGGDYLIRDLGAAEGTRLNGVLIREGVLQDGDEIQIGGTVLLFEIGNVADRSFDDAAVEDEGPPTDKIFKIRIGSGDVDFLKTEEKDPRRIRAAHRKLSTIHRISEVLMTIRNPQALFKRTLDLIVDAIRADRGCILAENEKGELVPQAVRVPAGMDENRAALSLTMAEEALREGKAILSSDAIQDARYEGKKSVSARETRSAMCVPLKTSERNLGVVSVHRTRPFSPFVEEDLEFLMVICRQATVCMENVQLFDDIKRTNHLLLAAKDEIVKWTRALEVKVEERTRQLRKKGEQLERLSITDGMTGLYNHQHFQNELAKEVRRMLRYRKGSDQKTFALAMLDLDHLKAINDSFGHLAGDGVLGRVAELLRANIRAVDLAARYGGDEFCLLLPETTLEGARVAVEKVIRKVRELEVTPADLLGNLSPEQLAEIGERLGRKVDPLEAIPITISAGLAVYQPPQMPREILQRADQALYRSKGAGRNQVQIG
ncbi:MAG: diguanylate cyclase [Planctomycetota bacterium]|nr:diguanylate cyclase [Planctomycetota bacterium]